MKDKKEIHRPGVSSPPPFMKLKCLSDSDSIFTSSEKIWFARNLAVLSAAVQFFIYAYWQIQSGNPAWAPHRLTSWLQDVVIIFILYIIAAKLLRPGELRSGRRYRTFFYMVIWSAAICLLMLYPRHLPDFMNFPVNIFIVDSGAANEFFRMFIAREEFIILPALAFLMIFFSYSLGHINLLRTGLLFNSIFFIIASSVFLFPPSNLFIFSVHDSIVSGLFGKGRQFPLLIQPDNLRAQKSAGEVSAQTPRSDFFQKINSSVEFYEGFWASKKISHIVVIVMETVEGKRFKSELLENKRTFIGSSTEKFRYFSNYFTLNLDSYTSLIAMLTGVFVPFRAYSDPEIYSGVQSVSNLITAMKKNGAACMFISPALNQPFIPARGEWDKILTRAALPHDPLMAHIDSPPIESAVEDRAAAPAIIEFMLARPRSFIMQECVYGHTQAWMDLTGKNQLEYYDTYIRELNEKLSAASLRDKTLIILTADHGSRQDPAEIENYLVPLIMWGPGIKPGVDSRFLSHVDFPGLVGEALCEKNWRPLENPIMTVGHSGKWVYGEICAAHEFQFLDNLRGRVLSSKGSSDPIKLNENFQRYLNDFSSKFPDRRQ